MTKKKIRKLMSEAAWSLMIGALLFLPLAIGVPNVRQSTSYLQTGMTLMIIGAAIDISKQFV